MRILKIEIKKLFNMFDYLIDLDKQNDLTILTGPNGYGKTTILNIIYNLFSKNFSFFQILSFEKIEIYLENNNRLSIKKTVNQKKTNTFHEVGFDNEVMREENNIELNLFDINNGNIGSFIYKPEMEHNLVRELEKYLPIARISQNIWIDRRTNKQIILSELLNEYSSFLPKSFIYNIKNQGIKNENILEVLSSLKVYLIKEQRLIKKNFSFERRQINSDRELSYVNTIEEYASELSSRIKQKQQEAYIITQKLDSSFPKRLLECKEDLSEANFNERFDMLIKKQSDLKKFGLSNSEQEPIEYNSENAKVLSVYLKDSEDKIEIYDPLLKNIEMFVNILNEKRFTHKTISINNEKGFVFTTNMGEELKLTDLSSGEQHEVVLLYELLFKIEENTLILIDEPEISLHVSWQKAFIEDLLKIAKMQNISVLVSTHSPQIINDRWDYAIDLFDLSKK
jgi:predicted ATP-binding protein involved in virulence